MAAIIPDRNPDFQEFGQSLVDASTAMGRAGQAATRMLQSTRPPAETVPLLEQILQSVTRLTQTVTRMDEKVTRMDRSLLETKLDAKLDKAWASARVKNQLATFNEDKLVPLSTKPTLAADAVEVPDLGRAPNCFPKTVKALRALSVQKLTTLAEAYNLTLHDDRDLQLKAFEEFIKYPQ